MSKILEPYAVKDVPWSTMNPREDVIASLFSDSRSSEEDFAGFCSSCGYDTDSRIAMKTWKACRRNARKLKAFIPEEHYGILYDLANEY